LGYCGFGFGADIAYKSKRTQEQLDTASEISHTLVITCMCTHKNAITISPCVFDKARLEEAWNTQFQDNRIDEEETKEHEGDKLYMVSGASYASALVGMVTFVNESKKQSTLDSEIWKKNFDSNMKCMKLLKALRPKKFKKEIKGSNLQEVMNMVANQTVSVHFNLYCSGLIPHLEKQKLETKIKLCQLDTKNFGDKMKELFAALGQGDTTKTSVLNVNTLMNAFDNYLSLASSGDTTKIGVPVNYFLKPITKSLIIDICKKENVQKKMGAPMKENVPLKEEGAR